MCGYASARIRPAFTTAVGIAMTMVGGCCHDEFHGRPVSEVEESEHFLPFA